MIIFPFTVDVPMQRWPWANWALIALTVVISVAVWFDKDHSLTDDEANRIAVYLEQTQPVNLERINRYSPRELTREDVKWTADNARTFLRGPFTHPLALHPADFHWWQPVTNLFVHGHWLLLLGNVVFLFCFGNAVNAKLGHLLYLVFYLGLGVVTDLDVVLAGSPVPSMGASGAIMGIMGVFAVLYPRNDVLIYYWVWAGQRFTGVGHISSIVVIFIYLLLDVIKLRTEGMIATGLIAHLLGMLTGMLVTMFLVHSDLIKMERGEENLLQWMGWKT